MSMRNIVIALVIAVCSSSYMTWTAQREAAALRNIIAAQSATVKLAHDGLPIIQKAFLSGQRAQIRSGFEVMGQLETILAGQTVITRAALDEIEKDGRILHANK